MSITNWPDALRPREKLLANGASELSDAELLAIFLRVGVTGKSAVDLAQELLDHFGSLSNLFNAPLECISQIKGIGSAKYVQLQAVLEMSKRALDDHFSKHPYLEHIDQLKALLKLYLLPLPYEVCMALLLDQHFRIIKIYSLNAEYQAPSQTSHANQDPQYVDHVQVSAKQIIDLMQQHAEVTGLILAHNHPNGCSKPSVSDIESTTALRVILGGHQYALHDHFIVGSLGPVHSMVEHGDLQSG